MTIIDYNFGAIGAGGFESALFEAWKQGTDDKKEKLELVFPEYFPKELMTVCGRDFRDYSCRNAYDLALERMRNREFTINFIVEGKKQGKYAVATIDELVEELEQVFGQQTEWLDSVRYWADHAGYGEYMDREDPDVEIGCRKRKKDMAEQR